MQPVSQRMQVPSVPGSGQTIQKTVTLSNSHPGQTAVIHQGQGHGQQQFIVTIGEPNNHENIHQEVQIQHGHNQVIYPGHHQYVGGGCSTPQANHAAFQPQSGFGQGNMYAAGSGTYYQTSPGGNQLTALGGQAVLHGGTYLIQDALDGDTHSITHTTRASPATVQWLIDNYETAEGVSLPRSTLYNHYLRHCQEHKMDPMNPASFGKLIRSVFLGLRTRRLGTRGNSKYHYYGIRIKPTSPLNALTDDHTLPMRQQPMNPVRKFKSSMGEGVDGGSGAVDGLQQHQQFLGDSSGVIPNFGFMDLGSDKLPDGVSSDYVQYFQDMYKKHCEYILGAVVGLHFNQIELLWQQFWRTTDPTYRTSEDHDMEQQLPKEALYALSQLESVQNYVRRCDYIFYQSLIEVLIPDVLRPIPSSLTQAMRNFAKSLEGWLRAAMVGVDEAMIKNKVVAVCAFAQTLRRYTSLNHLAQAARAVLQNSQQISQMLADLNRVDFNNVQEQASWVCGCEDGLVQQLEQDFKKTLQGQNSLEQWASWLEEVVNRVLSPYASDSPLYCQQARQFLLKWSFYSSMVIRDLTLRSAASFGSFHLIRLLYDEYMFYLVEHRIAESTGQSPIAVMGEDSKTNAFLVEPKKEILIAPKRIMTTALPAATAVRAVTVSGSTSAQSVTAAANLTNHTSAVTAGNTVQTSGGQKVTIVSANPGSSGISKTIVVVPVSSAGMGNGDPGPPVLKKIKTTT